MQETVVITMSQDGTITSSHTLSDEQKGALKAFLKVSRVNTRVSFNDQFTAIWNDFAKRNNWRPIRVLNKDLSDRLLKASKHYPTIEDWKIILTGMEADPFFSGKSGVYDRPKPLTLFYKNRFFEFYEAGSDVEAAPVDYFKMLLATSPGVEETRARISELKGAL